MSDFINQVLAGAVIEYQYRMLRFFHPNLAAAFLEPDFQGFYPGELIPIMERLFDQTDPVIVELTIS